MKNFPRMHVSLYVNNIAETVNFYTNFFGAPAKKVKKDYAKYELKNPNLIISFVENPERVQENFGHLGIQVETKEELESIMALTKEKAIDIIEEIGTNCCYASQDKFWVKDPNGVQWEVYYFHKDVEFNDPKYQSSDESAACCTPADTIEVKKEKKALRDLSNSQDSCCDPGSGCC